MSTVGTRPPTADPDAVPAELEPRLHAFALDRLLDVGFPVAVGWLLAGSGQAAWVVVAGVLVTVVAALLALSALLGLRGTSPGLAATGLRLVAAGGLAPVGFAAALRRQAVLLVAGVPTFGIGWATLAWTAVSDPHGLRRGWHDRLVDAVVVAPIPRQVAAPAPEAPPHQVVNLTALRLAPVERPPVRPPVRAPVVRPTTSPPVREAAWRVRLAPGEDVLVEGPTLLGREPQARMGETVARLVPLGSADLSVSKTHAQLEVAPDGSLVVMDRGSTNGSVVVRGGVPRSLSPGRPTTLLDGDLLRLGDRVLEVVRVTKR